MSDEHLGERLTTGIKNDALDTLLKPIRLNLACKIAAFAVAVIATMQMPAGTLHTNWVDGVAWIYTVQNGYASLGGGTSTIPTLLPGTKGDLTVPTMLGKYTVTNISSYAFANFTKITSIAVPKSIVTIQSAAFMGCNSLTNMVLPFVGNRRTDPSIYDQDSWTHELFGYIFGSSSAEGMTSVRQWYSSSWTGSRLYTTFSIPSSLESVSITDEGSFYHAVFENCTMLKSLTIPPSLKVIAMETFYNCNLRDIYISDLAAWCSMTGIGGNYAPDSSPMGYPRNLYLNGELIRDLVIPAGISEVRWAAFKGCTNITSVTIPPGVTIPWGTFSGCFSITNMITSFVGDKRATGSYDHPFGYMFGTSDYEGAIPYEGGIPVVQQYSYESWAQTKSNIPKGLKHVSVSRDGLIGYGAFQNCSMVEEITLGGNVTAIGNNAFNACSSLKSLVLFGDAPTVASGAFTGINTECVIYVLPSSTGWGVEIPGKWKGFSIKYYDGDVITIDQNLPHVVDDIPYSTQLKITGGSAPYTWTMDYSADGRLANDGVLTVYTTGRDITTSQNLDFKVTVMDLIGMRAKETLTVTIDPNPNLRPVIEGQVPSWDGTNGMVRIGEANKFAVDARDPEGAQLTYFWTLDYRRLDCTANEWTWTPERKDLGMHRLEVYCSDGERTSSTARYWNFVVVSTNVLKVSTLIPCATVGREYEASISASGGTEPYSYLLDMYRVNMNQQANSFKAIGIAQGWAEDDRSWKVGLPFDFPFYGSTYREIWVSDNGTICLDGEFSAFSASESAFRNHALIAPLWRDYNGRNQTIFVDTSIEGRITIRWQSKVYSSNSSANFSATLYNDGTVCFSYGSQSTTGCVGISAGNGNFFLPSELQNVDMAGAKDCTLITESIVPGLNPTSNGRILGVPTCAGGYQIPVCVIDADNVTWNGVVELVVSETVVTPVEGVTIPRSVVEDFMSKYPTLAAQAGNDPDAFAALLSVTGKLDANGNQMYIWQDIISGTDPTDPDDKFKIIDIKFEDGDIKVTWSPDLNENGTKSVRKYTEFGRKELGGSEGWTDMKDVDTAERNDYKFRKVTVDMP